MANEHDDHELDRLIGQFWAAFGAAAGKPIDPGCVDIAIDKNYYERVTANKKKLKDDKDYMKHTLKCCERAGKRANRFSGSKKKITADVFERACDGVTVALLRMKRKEARVQGGICF